MRVMAKENEDKSKPKRGRPAKPEGSARDGKPLHCWIDEQLREAMDEACRRNRRKLREEVSIALENYLRTLGLWPPAPPGSSPPETSAS
jgi:hypothetical protein